MAAVSQNSATAQTGLSKTVIVILSVLGVVLAFLLRGGVSTEGFDPTKLLDFGLRHDSIVVERTDRVQIANLSATLEARTEYIDSLEYEYRILAMRTGVRPDPAVIHETIAVQDPILRVRLDSLRYAHERILREMDSLRTRVVLSGTSIAQRTIRFVSVTDTSVASYDDTLSAIADVTRRHIDIQSNPEIIVHMAQLVIDCGEPWWVKPALVIAAILVKEVATLFIK